MKKVSSRTIKRPLLNIISISALISLSWLFSRAIKAYEPPHVEGEPPQSATLSGSRGYCPDYQEEIIPLFPEDLELKTSLAQPVFLFQLKSPVNNPIYFSLISDQQIEPIFAEEMESANRGLLAFKVPNQIKLITNQTYRLNFIILCDEQRPAHNLSVSALVKKVSPDNNEPISFVSESKEVILQAEELSRQGLWFDALAVIYTQKIVNEANFNQLLANYRQSE